MTHRSHITSREATVRGWSRVPSPSVRAETYSMSQEVGTEFMNGNYVTLTTSNTTGGLTTDVTWGDSAGTTWYPYQTWIDEWHTEYPEYPQTVTIQTIIKEKEVTKEVQKRTLYKVFVVDPRKSGKILSEVAVIAENENQAMLKANVLDVAEKAGMELEQLDVYCQLIGTFIRPRKDTQRVKVVKTEEEE